MTSALVKLPKQTIKIIITLSWNEIKSTYEKVLDELGRQTPVPGFRKGKAPKKLIERETDKTKIYEEVLKRLIPKAYADALKEHNLSPIVSPRINILRVEEGQNWQFEALTCLAPQVVLKNYKQEIAKLKGARKIWVPGSASDNIDSKNEEQKKAVELSEVLRVLLNQAELEIPDLLIEDEVNKRLSNLIDEVRKLGMTVEQYLLSKGLTTEALRAQYRKEAEETLKLEFILEKIADEEKITVTDSEIEEMIKKVTDQKQRETLSNQRYYLSMILRRQKTLDSLIKPIV